MSYSKPCLSITHLPTEIQLEIFSYLTDMNSQTSIYGTCTLWRRMLNEHAMLRAARYYRGRAPYTYFPVVHRFFDISPQGNGRCQVKDGAIVNYQYKTDAYGYINVSQMIANDTIFSLTYGDGWLAPDRQGTRANIDSKSVLYRAVKDGGDVEINHGTAVQEQDAEGEPSETINTLVKNDEERFIDAIWVNINIGRSFQRDNKNPSLSTWERITLPKGSIIGDLVEEFLGAITPLLDLLPQNEKPTAVDFEMDFREAFVSGSKPGEGWYLEIWVILPESLSKRLARLREDIERDRSGVVLTAPFGGGPR
ncbi:hypothetical protein TWF225_001385 [Orbilia oligospora]|uniref:F-box domain-containing protein n=1 Tax=Orbilia oligospora TaxID=2813651 RepID=A0A7C8PFN7_ORBOL|nr:hypothetical protein TWF751_008922 [Orbilia oligospora]KAF3191233.1 hypothetical protein TWF225_001385 [Orbilia oligospora]KAF3249611.1 hypothetical protein TWF217_008816 [Orbilia oligospora]KAF3269406.1 hypothetical protein TWF128_005642 [Orbilia oligospora]KAF3296686.1 hypothetical protein TWF132_010262 [Orbilia oligospora]